MLIQNFVNPNKKKITTYRNESKNYFSGIENKIPANFLKIEI